MLTPATPRRRPMGARPAPPARSRVGRIRPVAPREKRSAVIPAAAATGTAQPAWTSVTPARRLERSTPAGTASTATTPKRIASEARGLLLRVGPANSCGRYGASVHAGDGDERQNGW